MSVCPDESVINEDADGQVPAPEEAAGATALPSPIDVQKLADKVYQLMRDELRLEQARGQHIARRRSQ